MRGPVSSPLLVDILRAARQFLVAVMAWLVFWPITRIVPRRKELIAVLGRPGFSDNSKHFFAHAAGQPSMEAVFLTKCTDTLTAIENAGGKAIKHPSIKSMICLVRCQCLVSDVSDWFDYGVYAMTCGANRVQIWHGVPLKLIELADYSERVAHIKKWLRQVLWFHKAVIGRYPVFDLVISTSAWVTDNAFRHSFRSRQYLAYGYPRNDVFRASRFSCDTTKKLLKLNVDEQLRESIQAARDAGKLCCLYAPTFRKTMVSPFDTYLDLNEVSSFSNAHGILFIVKLHPFVKQKILYGGLSNIQFCDSLSDIYPLLPEIDVLITDYSSIYFDFLLLNRPIVFFPYDLRDYLENDRSMYFDYEEMTPGPKCFTQENLLAELASIKNASGNDVFADARRRLQTLIHDHCDAQASARLATYCAGRSALDRYEQQ